MLVHSLRKDLSFSLLYPVPEVWLTVCGMNGSRVRIGGPSHRALNMATCLCVSWEQRLPSMGGMGPLVGALRGASCAPGGDKKCLLVLAGGQQEGDKLEEESSYQLKAWFSEPAPPLSPLPLPTLDGFPTSSLIPGIQPHNAWCWVPHVIGTQ